MAVRMPALVPGALVMAVAMLVPAAHADENLFGYVRGTETLPQGAAELYQFATVRSNKGAGHYRATDYLTEIEYGLTHRLTVSGGLKLMSIDTSGIVIDGYMPGDKEFGPKFAGFNIEAKYNILSPAKDDIGLSTTYEFTHNTVDPHSGQKKVANKFEFGLQMQKYFAEGQLVWAANGAIEATHAKRADIPGVTIEWSTKPEVEIEGKLGTGLTYRFAPGWFAGLETQYETEYETEVGQERWSVFAGPTLHYASEKWWATVTWFQQIRGGGERFDEQNTRRLHLIEKTKNELRLKVGFNF